MMMVSMFYLQGVNYLLIKSLVIVDVACRIESQTDYDDSFTRILRLL